MTLLNTIEAAIMSYLKNKSTDDESKATAGEIFLE